MNTQILAPMKYALEIVYRKATEQETHEPKQYGFNYFAGPNMICIKSCWKLDSATLCQLFQWKKTIEKRK